MYYVAVAKHRVQRERHITLVLRLNCIPQLQRRCSCHSQSWR